MTPHTCPVCDGRGQRPDDSTPCVACAATGIVWASGTAPARAVEHHHHHYHSPYDDHTWTVDGVGWTTATVSDYIPPQTLTVS